jgi:hypothetical protein
MGKTYAIQYQPLPLRYWLHEHQRLVGSSMGLIIVILAAALATVSISIVQDAIAKHTEPSVIGAEVTFATELPREWTTRPSEPITFDHMFRDSAPHAGIDFIRNPPRGYYGSASE